EESSMFNVDRRITMVVLLAAFGAPPTMAQEAAWPPSELAASSRTRPGIISTHAESLRRLPNTVSDASVGIEVHGRDLRGTATALARQSQALLTFLRGQTTERLRTDGTSFEPEIQELKGQPDRIKGYTGRLTVSFRTTPEQLPLLLAGCLDNGATSLGQFGSSPRETEIEAARREMVAEATQAALAQARTIADTVGQKIAGVELVQVNPAPGAVPDLPSMPYMAERAAKMAAPVPPVASQAGDSGLSVTVVMTLRVAPPS
ncbi:MAG: SIMPL domain-containing protein, partial [Janthinobacterium lividum]